MPLTRAQRVALAETTNQLSSPTKSSDILTTKSQNSSQVTDASQENDASDKKASKRRLGGAQRVGQEPSEESPVKKQKGLGPCARVVGGNEQEATGEDTVPMDAETGSVAVTDEAPVISSAEKKATVAKIARDRLIGIKSKSRNATSASILSWEISSEPDTRFADAAAAKTQPIAVPTADATANQRNNQKRHNGSGGASSCLSWDAPAPEVSSSVSSRKTTTQMETWGSQSLGDVMNTCAMKTSSHLGKDSSVTEPKESEESEVIAPKSKQTDVSGWGSTSLDDVMATTVKKTTYHAIGKGAVEEEIEKEASKDAEDVNVEEEAVEDTTAVVTEPKEDTAETDDVEPVTESVDADETAVEVVASPAAVPTPDAERVLSRKERLAAEQAAIWGGQSLDAALVKPVTPKVDNSAPRNVSRRSRLEQAKAEALAAFGGGSLGDTMAGSKRDTRDYGNHAKKTDESEEDQ